MDCRALQDPSGRRAPRPISTALLAAFDADTARRRVVRVPARLRRRRPDRRRSRTSRSSDAGSLPPTRLAALRRRTTVDPFVLRGASIGAAWRAERGGAAGRGLPRGGSGALPIASRPADGRDPARSRAVGAAGAFYAPAAAIAFGRRLRGQLLRDAAAVIVGTEAVARRPGGCSTSGATGSTSCPGAAAGVPRPPRGAGDRRHGRRPGRCARLGLGERYLVYPGRYDVRQDLRHAAGRAGRPRPRRTARPSSPADGRWPPRILLVGATPDDRAALARAAARRGVGESLAYAPGLLEADAPGAARRGARGVVLPVVSEARGLAAIEALAAGTPVVASAVGALPEIVGPAGMLVEPRDASAWRRRCTRSGRDGPVHDRRRRRGPRAGTMTDTRTWADVAAETGRSTRRSVADGGCGPAGRARPLRRAVGAARAAGDGDAAGGFGSVSTTLVEVRPAGMTWMKVWPTVSVTGLPSGS